VCGRDWEVEWGLLEMGFEGCRGWAMINDAYDHGIVLAFSWIMKETGNGGCTEWYSMLGKWIELRV